MSKLISFLSFLILSTFMIPATYATDDETYQYFLDLTNVKDDKVQVQLLVPKIDKSTIIFSLPKIIPGTYKVADYGRFVTEFKAMDKKGRELEVMQLDKNSWEIENANKLHKITYWVDDTYDTELTEDAIYPMAGTNIEDGKNYVINTPGFFGYFQDMKEIPFDLQILKPESFYGSTGLIPNSELLKAEKLQKEFEFVIDDSDIDYFTTTDYNQLIDSPLMYCEPDTAVINVAGAEVLISVYSPADLTSSDYVAEQLATLLRAQMNFLGGKLPVDKYAFIYYMEDLSKLAPVQGALEHSYSSFYYFPDIDQETLKPYFVDTGAHEFFHIVTPLTIHSEQIAFFDFNTPQMSEHLWLYEGVTEYFAGNVQVKYDIITPEEYLEVLSGKIDAATRNYDDELSFTDLSKYTLEKYGDQYGNVYQKGALIGMCMDLIMLETTNGMYGMQNLVFDLQDRFGIEKAFKDDELFDVIEELTGPELRAFLDTYVRGGGPLPYAEVFAYAGVNYADGTVRKDYSIGNISLGLNTEQKLIVADTRNLNEFGKALGYQDNDVLLSINGNDIPSVLTEIQGFFDDVRANMQEGDTLSITVLRENEAGEPEETELSAEIFKVDIKEPKQIGFVEDASERQLMVRDAWLKPREL